MKISPKEPFLIWRPFRRRLTRGISRNDNTFSAARQDFNKRASNGIDAILARNIKDYVRSKIPVFTSENYLKTFRGEKQRR